MRPGSLSLADVARLSGTSLATVSRVLSNSNHPVKAATREKVRAAALSLGYKPNAIARALATQRTRTIGVIVGDIADPYFGDIARGIEDNARPHGYLTIICNGDRDIEVELAHFEMLMEHKVAAILFAGGSVGDTSRNEQFDALMVKFRQEGRVVIALAPRWLGNVPTLMVNNEAVAHDMTQRLIELGHRNIAFVGGPDDFLTSNLRQVGFKRAMAEAGLDGSMIYNEGFALESGRRAVETMLSGTLPEAILAANDNSAVGAMLALRSAGVDVPGQISVAGIDDLWLSVLMDLTTVSIPIYELGAMAARLILEGIDDHEIPSMELPHQIVMRGSTAPRPR